MGKQRLTQIQEDFLQKICDSNFSPSLAYLMATGCQPNSAKVKASQLLRHDGVRAAILIMIEDKIHNLLPAQRVRANALYSKLLSLEVEA